MPVQSTLVELAFPAAHAATSSSNCRVCIIRLFASAVNAAAAPLAPLTPAAATVVARFLMRLTALASVTLSYCSAWPAKVTARVPVRLPNAPWLPALMAPMVMCKAVR